MWFPLPIAHDSAPVGGPLNVRIGGAAVQGQVIAETISPQRHLPVRNLWLQDTLTAGLHIQAVIDQFLQRINDRRSFSLFSWSSHGEPLALNMVWGYWHTGLGLLKWPRDSVLDPFALRTRKKNCQAGFYDGSCFSGWTGRYGGDEVSMCDLRAGWYRPICGANDHVDKYWGLSTHDSPASPAQNEIALDEIRASIGRPRVTRPKEFIGNVGDRPFRQMYKDRGYNAPECAP
jgi:hypothetical protein